MSIFEYFLKVNIYLLLFYAFYRFLLQNETFYQLNRAFLLIAALGSFLIPLIHADWVSNWFNSSEIVQGKTLVHDIIIAPMVYDSTDTASGFSLSGTLGIIYFTVVILLAIRLLYRIYIIKYHFTEIDDLAYSFFNKIIIPPDQENYDTIYKHERLHVQQLHSLDVLLFEVLSIIIWFNPVIYLYKKSIKSIHEFLADEMACVYTGKEAYARLLLSQTMGIQTHDLVNSFYNHSLLKKRIIMLGKSKSNKSALVKYGLSAPLFIAMLVFSSAKIDKLATRAENFSAVGLDKSVNPFNLLSERERPALSLFLQDDKPMSIANVEVLPQFPEGGDAGFGKFLGRTIQYPAEAKANNISGRVLASFIVEKDGTLSNIKVLQDIGGGCGVEAIRVLKMSPKWTPGMHNGKPVRVEYVCPIGFSVTPMEAYNKTDEVKAIVPEPESATKTYGEDDIIHFASVEVLPVFPTEGDAGFGKFLGRTIQYPAEAKENNITGRVIVSFVVEKDGSLTDIKVLRDIGGGCGDEAVRVLKLSPKWIPGTHHGKPVRVAYTCPIAFSLAKIDREVKDIN
jgi:TonB family protein